MGLYTLPFLVGWSPYFIYAIVKLSTQEKALTEYTELTYQIPFWVSALAIDIPALQGFLNALVYGRIGLSMKPHKLMSDNSSVNANEIAVLLEKWYLYMLNVASKRDSKNRFSDTVSLKAV